MSRVRPSSKRHLLYLGEISEPPSWLPANTHSAISPILAESRVGAYILENPSPDDIQDLERNAREGRGLVTSFTAGGSDFCAYIGPPGALCDAEAKGEAAAHTVLEDIAAAAECYSADLFDLSLASGLLRLGERTRIMGILNVTPDSFSDGGRFHNFDAAVAQGEKMVEEGADIIDIGGESTRPGSEAVSVEEEAGRVVPVIKHLSKNSSIPISIDTCKAEIAARALDAGAEIVNDVSALRFDAEMARVVRDSGCPLILMHMQGTPKVMQDEPHYDALMPEIISFLQERIDAALERGIDVTRIIVDPGIGFGKTVEHNLEILRDLTSLRALGRPILVGSSRKATIGAVLGTEPDDRVEGTAATVAAAVAHGAHIVRVHDVKQIARVARMTDAIMGRNWE